MLLMPISVVADYKEEKAQVLALADLVDPPKLKNAASAPESIQSGDMKTIYFDALDYEGKPTRVYAWIGIPASASKEKPVPGIVLVHGGGGTAFDTWVKKWTAKGYAAISIAVEGQTDQKNTGKNGKPSKGWQQHAWPGPARNGIYGDSDKPLKDQWMYHAVANTILGNSLMHSLPMVDSKKIGVMGISWGGVITSTVIGIDHRFAFAIPTYGCGNLAEAENQYGRALGNNQIYRQVWDPMVRIDSVTTPTLWLSWPGDQHFPLDKQAASYTAAPGDRMVSLIPGMKHSHGAGWNPEDSYAFADSVVETGKAWASQSFIEVQNNKCKAIFSSTKAIDKAILVSTTDTGITGDRKWSVSDTQLSRGKSNWTATTFLPKGTTAWFINLKSGNLTISSDYQEVK